MGRFMSRMGVSAAVAAMAGGVASAGVFQTITIDGNLGDWDGPALFYADGEIGDASNADAGYNAVYVANDATNLYVAIVTDGAAGGDITHPWTHNLYIDTDTDGTTGFDGGWMTNGYDVLAQYGASGTTGWVHGFTGANQGDFSWSGIGALTYSYSGNVIEWSIPLSYFGAGVTAVVPEFNVTGGGLTGETWASAPESAAKTYTIAPIPEPASLMLLAAGGAFAMGKRR